MQISYKYVFLIKFQKFKIIFKTLKKEIGIVNHFNEY